MRHIKSPQLIMSGRDGGKEAPIQTAAIWSPAVLGLQGDLVTWDADSALRTRNHGTGLLFDFKALAEEEDPEAFFRFAKKWGTLAISPVPISASIRGEPLSAWRDLARRVKTLHELGCSLNAGSTGTVDDWMLFLDAEQAKKIVRSVTECRFKLMSEVRKLIDLAGLRPRFYWRAAEKGGGWQIDFDANGKSNLLAILTLQLMIRIAEQEGCARCSLCNGSYIPERQPARTKKNYCPKPECQRNKWKILKREQREKKGQDGHAQTKTR